MDSNNQNSFFEWSSNLIKLAMWLMLPFIWIWVLFVVPQYWEARKKSEYPIEKIYWTFLVIAFGSIGYVLTVVFVSIIFWLFTGFCLFDHWPAVSSIFMSKPDHDVAMASDLMWCIIFFFVGNYGSNLFGSHNNETLDYSEPMWHYKARELQRVDQALAKASQGRPSLEPKYAHLTEREKFFLDKKWTEQYEEAVKDHKWFHSICD
jgi:hypothetical protein